MIRQKARPINFTLKETNNNKVVLDGKEASFFCTNIDFLMSAPNNKSSFTFMFGNSGIIHNNLFNYPFIPW